MTAAALRRNCGRGTLWTGVLCLAPLLARAQASPVAAAPQETWLRAPTLGTLPALAIMLYFAGTSYRQGRLSRLGALGTALSAALALAMPTLVHLGRLRSGPIPDPARGLFIQLPLTAALPIGLLLALSFAIAYREGRLTAGRALAVLLALACILALPGIMLRAMGVGG